MSRRKRPRWPAGERGGAVVHGPGRVVGEVSIWPKIDSIHIGKAGGINVSVHELPGVGNTMNREIEVSGPGGADGYVTIQGLEAPAEVNKIKLVHAVVLPKITYTVQPYSVRAHLKSPAVPDANPPVPAQWHDVSPATVPSSEDLETCLNEIYEKQMNVHFTVNPVQELGNVNAVNYDIGVPGKTGSENNRILDVGSDLSITSSEEEALYTAGHTPSVINVYFLPSYAGKMSLAGTSRPAKKAALISNRIAYVLTGGPNATQEAKNAVMQTVAHEIGHLGMGPESAELCLLHPRPKGLIIGSDGIPLRRQSDDMKRLMWWLAEPNRKLLIKDEWVKFRASKK